MSDISNLKIGNNVYSIKDTTARTTATETLEISLQLGTIQGNNE